MKQKFLLGVLAICCLLSTASFSYAQEEDYLEEGKEWTIQASTGSGVVLYRACVQRSGKIRASMEACVGRWLGFSALPAVGKFVR